MPRPGPRKRRPKPPGRGKRRPAAQRHSPGLRLTWRGLIDVPNEQVDQPHQRFFKGETLQNAVARLVSSRDTLIAPALDALDPGMQPHAIAFELHYEFAHALVFRAAAAAKGRKPLEFRLIVAKDDQERSKRLRRTWKALAFARDRAPDHVVRPLSSATVFLPDRHRRTDKGRDIFCCTTAAVPAALPLCVARGGRLAELAHAPRLLSVREEAQACIQMIQLAARLYDPKAQTGVLLPDLTSNQIEVTRKAKSIALHLVLPDGLRTRLTVPRFVHELVTWNVSGAGAAVRVKPPEVDAFYGALSDAVGVETATDWLARYKRSVVQGKLPVVPPLEPAELEAIGIP